MEREKQIRICRDYDMKLNEICEVYSGYALKVFNNPEDGLPVVKIGNILTDGTLNLEECQYTTDSVNEKYYSQRGDIYIALSGATTGKIGIMDAGEKYVINQRVGIVRQKSDGIPQEYIKYFLLRQTDRILQEAAGCAQPNISPKQIAEYVIPDTSREKMQEICEVLDRIKKIMDSRKAEISVLDDLIKARFVEMFGLPVSNTKGWQTELMEDVAPIVNYKGKFDEEIWLLNLDMVEAQTGRILDYLIVNEDEVGNSTCTFDASNVLYSKLRPYLNKVVIPDRCGYATSELIPLQPVNTKINREYLAFMLRSDEFVNMINEKVAGAKMPRVSMGDFRKFSVPVPPIELQNQFADFVNQVDKSKVAVQKALDETQLLFDSLMQQYFG